MYYIKQHRCFHFVLGKREQVSCIQNALHDLKCMGA
jgi:hypothetical protein